ARVLGCGDAGLEAAEQVLRAGLLKLGGGMLGEVLSADPGYRGPRVDCGHGHKAVFTGYREKVIDTVLGPVTLRRAWYHCARCEHGLAPRDAELGAAGASTSPGLRAMSDKAAAAVPFAHAARLLEDLAGVRLTVKRVERAAEASGSALAAASRERAGLITQRKLIPLPPDPLPDKLYIVIDGTGVPMTSKETTGRDGKGEDGRARTREAKMAVFFTQDKLDAKGYPVRDKTSSSYIATFEPAAAFQRLVRAEGIRRGADHVRQLTVIGDGAAWIWNLAAATFPEATHIVDLYHAREHLHSLARSLEFMLHDRRDEWLAARMEDLDYGYIDGIAAAVREYPLEGVKKDEAARELGYFLNNAPRMRYHWFRSRGLFVGSGVVEAGCKAVIGQRLKQSGMHWTVPGADSIITLRCAQASSQWEAICNHRHNQTSAA
ncbi:MAG TPA: ISKra4 family transposase, partial [Solirubrobacteraceae bacterium]|nr:ISKra4 family transposase [Solirubrobacteraceae bacterium]